MRPLSVLLLICVACRAACAADALYRNPAYGFSVVVPSGRSFLQDAPPRPQHGILLQLAQGRAWVDGSYDAQFRGSAEAILRDRAADAGLNAAPHRTHLSGLPAARLRAITANTVHDLLVALRKRPGGPAIAYTIGLDTGAATTADDERVFDALVHSFALLPLPP